MNNQVDLEDQPVLRREVERLLADNAEMRRTFEEMKSHQKEMEESHREEMESHQEEIVEIRREVECLGDRNVMDEEEGLVHANSNRLLQAFIDVQEEPDMPEIETTPPPQQQPPGGLGNYQPVLRNEFERLEADNAEMKRNFEEMRRDVERLGDWNEMDEEEAVLYPTAWQEFAEETTPPPQQRPSRLFRFAGHLFGIGSIQMTTQLQIHREEMKEK